MYDQSNTGYGNAGYQNNYGYQPQPITSTSSYNSANAQYDDPSQQLAQTLCNISPDQWNNGQTQNIQNCMKNYTVDFFVNQQPGGPNATWMIVRDTSFLPGSIDSLTTRRPNIPIIIGTVQDEDADYAFKLINTGKGSDPNNLDDWIFDFARKNKLNQTQANQVSNIISNNYGVNTGALGQQGAQVNSQYQGSGTGQQVNNQYQNTQGQQTNNQYQYDQGGQQTNNQGAYYGGVVAGQQTTYQNQNQNQQGVQRDQGSYQNQYSNQNQQVYNNPGSYQQQQQQQSNNQQVYSNQGNTYSQTNNQNQYGSSGQNQNQNQQTSNQYQNNGVYTNVTQYSNVNNNYGYQRDQPATTGMQTVNGNGNGVTDFSQLRTISSVGRSTGWA